MRYISAQLEHKIRIVALATSLSNAKDLGEWIGCTSQTVFNFQPSVRPVPLDVRVQGYNIAHFASMLIAMSKVRGRGLGVGLGWGGVGWGLGDGRTGGSERGGACASRQMPNRCVCARRPNPTALLPQPAYTAVAANPDQRKPAIVFVPSRKQARLTALEFVTHAIAEDRATQFLHCSADDLEKYLKVIQDPSLVETLKHGMNAG